VKKREQKTADELAALIAWRLGIPKRHVSVNKDPGYGWHPTIFGNPSNAYRYQIEAELMARGLRAEYERLAVRSRS
jgi:hypothetical protein